jgi:putative ABC transport system permease protein
MTLRSHLNSFMRNLLGKKRVEQDLDEEIQSTLALMTAEKIKQGMNPQEAARAARVELGGVEQVKEEVRAIRAGVWLETIVRDTSFGLRMLRKNPGFTAIAVLTLAFGIGANTAIFSVVNAVLLRPLPFPDASRIMMVWHTPPQKSFPGVKRFVVSPANYLDWRRQNHVFNDMAALGFGPFNLTGNGEPESILGAKVSADFFSVLRVRPEMGRAFVADDDQSGHGNVVILTDAFWRSHFDANRNVLGTTIRMDDQPYLVIGVMPAEFSFPLQAKLAIPLAWTDKERAVRGNHNLLVIARLKSGVSQQQAQAEMDTISSGLAQQYPDDDAGWGAAVVPFHDFIGGSVRSALLLLLGSVAFVLLIACTNVANLTLAKALGRRKEIAIRTVLGASRSRVMRQVLPETLLLSLAGGTLALLLAHFLVDAIAAFLAPQLPLSVTIGLDGWVLAFTLAISVLTGIIAGLAPSWHLAKANLNASLKQGLGKTDSASSGGRARCAFVVAEVALSLVLLIGAGLTIQTLYLLRSVNPGFDPHNVLTVPLAISETKYASGEQQTAFFDDILERVRALPGVNSVGAVDDLPFRGGSTQPIIAEGQPAVPMADQPEVPVRVITPGFLRAMGIPLLQGRDISDADKASSQPVVLVSQAFAKRFWPHDSPIGKHVTLTFSRGASREVVGVVGDVKIDGLDVTQPIDMVYEAMEQNARVPGMVLTVRTGTGPAGLVSAVTDVVHQVDAEEPVVGIVTMDTVVDQSLGKQQLSMTLLGAFAGLALLLAAIGIYGVQAYAVRQQVREIGIRMALGAQRRDVFRLVVGQGLRLTLLGIGIGIVAAFGITRFMASQLYGLSPTDPVTFVGVTVLLMFVALLACYVPARRAMRVDPMVALRYE